MKLNNYLVTLLFLISCGKPLPVLDRIDMDAWKNDKNGCGQVRMAALATLDTQLSKLTGLSEMEVVKLLGRPDENELYKRNEKFYHYNLSPGPLCGQQAAAKKLTIRFNAIGLAKEVIIE